MNYPPLLVAGHLRGTRKEFEAAWEILNFDFPVPEDPVIPRDSPQEALAEIELHWGDANGGYLDPKVQSRRASGNVGLQGLRTKRPIEECLRITGKEPMPLRWFDTNKGDEARPEHRSRRVAKDLKT